MIPVGPSPVGVLLVDHDRYVLVANSNRFAETSKNQYLSVIDAAAALADRRSIVGTIPVGRFPRELAALDETHALVGNYLSETVEVVATDGFAK